MTVAFIEAGTENRLAFTPLSVVPPIGAKVDIFGPLQTAGRWRVIDVVFKVHGRPGMGEAAPAAVIWVERVDT